MDLSITKTQRAKLPITFRNGYPGRHPQGVHVTAEVAPGAVIASGAMMYLNADYRWTPGAPADQPAYIAEAASSDPDVRVSGKLTGWSLINHHVIETSAFIPASIYNLNGELTSDENGNFIPLTDTATQALRGRISYVGGDLNGIIDKEALLETNAAADCRVITVMTLESLIRA